MSRISIKSILIALSALFLAGYFVCVWWSIEPDIITPKEEKNIPGYATTKALIDTMDKLLNKPGGWVSNDITPPGIFMDNMPSFEVGALEQVRDMALIMRNDFSRSQSQSTIDPDLAKVQERFNINADSWSFPSAESEYKLGIRSLNKYLTRISDPNISDAQFYTRADNLNEWLKLVQKRLGNLSQRLSASTGQKRFNLDLAGDVAASSSTVRSKERFEKTSWFFIDNIFYEARGSNWALLNLMKAIEIDFADVLKKKNATVMLQQIIRELEESEQTIWSPMVLNGSGFGFLANHSLVMANYISRANAAIIDLSNLLDKG